MSERPLWAPWRAEFIRGPKSDECFLCGNRKPDPCKAENAWVVFRGRSAFVMLNRFPYNSGHLLIAPYRHVATLRALSGEERSECMELAARCEAVLETAMKPAGYNVGFNLGTAAGASVAAHLHMHVVPRWVGDTNFLPVLANTRCVPETLEKTAELLTRTWEELS
ncbi:MAG: HIT domain-containing protein [Victivallaceae bacterium]|nr:HIT domain-containing protein [Victivallaceae bacterium]